VVGVVERVVVIVGGGVEPVVVAGVVEVTSVSSVMASTSFGTAKTTVTKFLRHLLSVSKPTTNSRGLFMFMVNNNR